MKQEKQEEALNSIVKTLTELVLFCDPENASETLDGLLAEIEYRIPSLKKVFIKNEKAWWQNFRLAKRKYCLEYQQMNNCLDCEGCLMKKKV